MKRYIYLCEPTAAELDEAVHRLAFYRMDGAFLIEPNIDAATVRFAERLKAHGFDLILVFNGWPPAPDLIGHHRMAAFDFARLDWAKQLTNKIALGSNPKHEWGGYPNDVELAGLYRRFADAEKFEWICTIGYGELVRDIRSRKLRAALGDTPCVCLCGHILAGYVFADPRIPNQGYRPDGKPWGSLTGHDLHKELGLNFESLRDYVSEMDIMSGAGHQEGLDAGSLYYLHQLGFSGWACSLPLRLATNILKVNGPADRPPKGLGIWTEGYVTP